MKKLLIAVALIAAPLALALALAKAFAEPNDPPPGYSLYHGGSPGRSVVHHGLHHTALRRAAHGVRPHAPAVRVHTVHHGVPRAALRRAAGSEASRAARRVVLRAGTHGPRFGFASTYGRAGRAAYLHDLKRREEMLELHERISRRLELLGM